MHVDLLLNETSALLSVLSPLGRLQVPTSRVSTHVLSSWEELESRAAEAAFDLAIVQPDFPGGNQCGKTNVGKIVRVRDAVGPGGLVHFVSEDGFRKGLLDDLHRLGCRFVIIQGTDDHPRSILRILSRALTCRTVQARLLEDDPSGIIERRELLLASLVGWPPPGSVSDLACRFHTSPRNLRRKMEAYGLLGPRQMIRWGCLLEVCALQRLGVKTRAHLAAILGVGDPTTLVRLCRDLTALSPEEVLTEKYAKHLLDILVSQLKSA